MLARSALSWSATALFGATCALLTYFWLPPRVASSSAASSAITVEARATGATANDGSARNAPAQTNGDELETTQKAVVQALLQARPDAPEPASPSVRALETLDRRMADAAPDAANTARMEQSIDAVLASGVLGTTRAEKVCGATMCRVDLANPDVAQLNQSNNALGETLPKLFVRSLVLPGRNGGLAMYMGTDAEAFRLAPPSEREVFVAAPSVAPQ